MTNVKMEDDDAVVNGAELAAVIEKRIEQKAKAKERVPMIFQLNEAEDGQEPTYLATILKKKFNAFNLAVRHVSCGNSF